MHDSGTLPEVPNDTLTFTSLLQAARRRRRVLVWPALLMLALGSVSCFISTPRYRATAEIQVLKEDGGAFGLESNVTGQAGAAPVGDSLDYNMTLQTEAGILRSPALAFAVIEATGLERTPDYFAPPTRSSGSMFARWAPRLPWRKPLEPLDTPLRNAPNRRFVAEKIFKAHLKIQPLAGTRLLEVSYTDPDPVRAAVVANTCTRVLAEMDFQQHLTATLQGSTWLSGQLEELRNRTEEAQARAARLQRGTGMFGNDASRNVVLERLDSLNQTLTAAESNRILKESIDQVASKANPELISSLSGNSNSGAVASINTSLSLIQGLRAQEAQVRAELAEASTRYGPSYPKIAELQARLSGLKAATTAETNRLGQRAHTDWEVAVRTEQAARAAFERQKQLAVNQNDSVLAYQLAREEADSSRALYEGLLSKLKQASLLGGLRFSNISVVSAAEIPPPNHPSSPNMPLRIAGAAVFGLLLGLCSAGYKELVDESIHSFAEMEVLIGVPLLAALPTIARPSSGDGRWTKANHWMRSLASGDKVMPAVARPPVPSLLTPAVDRKHSAYSEQLRCLRALLLRVATEHPLPKVLLVTSCLPGEGKTTVSLNLAVTLALGGSRVLLVDADLRRPAASPYGSLQPTRGLAFALSGPGRVQPCQPLPDLPNLCMLADAQAAPLTMDLLASSRLPELLAEWKAAYDVVILDSPAVLPVHDAVLLAQHSDAVLLLARHERTTRTSLRRSVDRLRGQVGPAVPIGVILNQVTPASGEFQQHYGYTQETLYAN